MSEIGPERQLVERLAEEFVERYRAGERPSLDEYAAAHPQHADEIRDLFPALVLIEELAPNEDSSVGAPGAPAAAAAPLERVGDYRILREIGRGGMGVVYEAEQESLGRRVALKVLHVQAGQDARILWRFRRECRAAAQLHHTNIVPVFEVGQQGDLCYYAMQFIRGQTLDQVFRELQHLRASSVPSAAREGATPIDALTQSHWTGAGKPACAGRPRAEHQPAALPDRSELSSVASNYRRYCRNVARLGLQAAEALAYAHAAGIVHRDIKPANLLLDTTGVLWVSDFGLAKTQDPALTDTGDLLGTLRYMAPERFRGECDARADVYALGLTLYELLVLRPAFDGKDRLHLADQIGRQEPTRPRALDHRIPRDLETIIMKTIEKDLRRRYASASLLAEDLHRFLADEPIRARRIGPLERLGRWGRRNPLVAGLSAAVVLLAALGFVGVFGQMQVAQANEREAQEHATRAEREEHEAKKERDEVKALNEKLKAAQEQLRRTTYAAHINLAQQAWETSRIGRVLELLEQERPKKGERDLRGFEWIYLKRLCHTDLLTLKLGYTGGGISTKAGVAFSPDGKHLASATYAGNDPVVKVWDAQTGKELFVLKGHKPAVAAVVFSSDGKRLLTCSNNWYDFRRFTGKAVYEPEVEVKVWDVQTGKELRTFSLPNKDKDQFVDLAFSPDGSRLASVGYVYVKGLFDPAQKGVPDATKQEVRVRVWDVQTGKEVLTLPKLTGLTFAVAFSPDGKRLAGANGKVWNAQTGKELLILKGYPRTISSVAFSPDGNRLASSGKVWDAQTGKELLTLEGLTGPLNIMAFSPDGNRLATTCGSKGGPDPTVVVWDAQAGKQLLVLKGHTGSTVQSVVFSPDGTRLASGGDDGTAKVWDVAPREKVLDFLKILKVSPANLVLSPDFKRVAASRYIDETKKAEVREEIKIFDAQTHRELQVLKGHTGVVNGVAFSPDGTRLASASADNTVKVWDVQTGKNLLTFKSHGGAVVHVTFSPDGKRLASAGRGEVKVWDAQIGKELLSFKGQGGQLVFSPDGNRLILSSFPRIEQGKPAGGQVKVWDAQTGKELFEIKGHVSSNVVFSPDGKRLAGSWRPSIGEVGALKVWDARTGQELLIFKGYRSTISSVAFSPDGRRLASASRDGTVKVWDAQTGHELLTLTARGPSGRLAFSPDGNRLATITRLGVEIWDATPLPEKR
jgi:WD40 repeat protein/serine/threonine protein kinase